MVSLSPKRPPKQNLARDTQPTERFNHIVEVINPNKKSQYTVRRFKNPGKIKSFDILKQCVGDAVEE